MSCAVCLYLYNMADRHMYEKNIKIHSLTGNLPGNALKLLLSNILTEVFIWQLQFSQQ